MFVRAFRPERFLRSVYGTPPFLDFCRTRDIPFVQVHGGLMGLDDYRRWTDVLRTMPAEKRLQTEVELAKVNELSDDESIAHLTAALDGSEPAPDSVPGGAALALWFFLQHADLFHEVLLREEIGEADCWRTAKAPADLLRPDALEGKAAGLANGLQKFFRLYEGTGLFCAVEVHHMPDAYCFIAYVADRLQLLDTFSDAGEHIAQRLRPAFTVTFVYYPSDGTVLLRGRIRSFDHILELLRSFGHTVLGVELTKWCLASLFDLDQLKRGFHPLPDAEDMEEVRLKAIHLSYPERHGRRQVKLETRTGDKKGALPRLLKKHMRRAGMFAELHVSYAELQIGLRVGGARCKQYILRLWPNGCNISQSVLGDRFRACLKRWGLVHEEQS